MKKILLFILLMITATLPMAADKSSGKTRLGNHKPIGCVNIALGQAIATMGKFRGTFYGNKSIDFNALPEELDLSSNPGDILQINHFLQEIALNCQTKFRCDGGYTAITAAVNYLRDIGYKVDQIDGGLDKTRFISYLQQGHPHISSGYNDKGKGHAWILDGIVEHNGMCNFHINWGNGGNASNGWSSEYYFTVNAIDTNNYYKDRVQIYIGEVPTE